MPRYFFDVYDGEQSPDLDGTVLPDAHVMRQEAMKFVASLLAEEPMRLALGSTWRLIVRDGTAVVLQLEVKI